MASADYINQEIKGTQVSFDNASQIVIEKYAQLPVFSIQVTDQFSELFTSTESFSAARKVTEQETPDLGTLGDGYAVSMTSDRFAGGFEITSQDMVKMKDGTTKVDVYLDRQRDKALKDMKNLFVRNLHLFFNEAFDSGSDYLAPDGAELCGTHTWNSTGTTFSNAITAKLDSEAVDVALEVGTDFVDAEGKEFPLTYNTIVVRPNSDNARMAKKLFAEGISPTAINDINIYESAVMTIIETPYITSANKDYWFMFDSEAQESPLYAGVNQMPQLKDGIKQNNEAVRHNVEGFWKQGIDNMPWNILGSDGTT